MKSGLIDLLVIHLDQFLVFCKKLKTKTKVPKSLKAKGGLKPQHNFSLNLPEMKTDFTASER